ncbi:hypothetical protein ADUPG1_008454 [Aduncisulcus paluster]|uniref:Uncharacterized protein n=1 Tax=Aduncisulcus paluster TaxID=2918883 RepID=A0ABQ5KS19_9EUKA|nr:hypothetical protein ADUPG1_008454 [Aduncisulcus paluster]
MMPSEQTSSSVFVRKQAHDILFATAPDGKAKLGEVWAKYKQSLRKGSDVSEQHETRDYREATSTISEEDGLSIQDLTQSFGTRSPRIAANAVRATGYGAPKVVIREPEVRDDIPSVIARKFPVSERKLEAFTSFLHTASCSELSAIPDEYIIQLLGLAQAINSRFKIQK